MLCLSLLDGNDGKMSVGDPACGLDLVGESLHPAGRAPQPQRHQVSISIQRNVQRSNRKIGVRRNVRAQRPRQLSASRRADRLRRGVVGYTCSSRHDIHRRGHSTCARSDHTQGSAARRDAKAVCVPIPRMLKRGIPQARHIRRQHRISQDTSNHRRFLPAE